MFLLILVVDNKHIVTQELPLQPLASKWLKKHLRVLEPSFDKRPQHHILLLSSEREREREREKEKERI